MKLRLANEQDQSQWNQFISENEGGSFMQSWEWGTFISTQKEKIWRLVVEDNNNNWLAVMFLFKSKLKLNQSILYSPRGPVIAIQKADRAEIFSLFMAKVTQLSVAERAMMFQVDPYSSELAWERIFDDLEFDKCEQDIQPRHTLILDIRQDDHLLLKDMHQKTRYNINLAKKKDVTIEVDNSQVKEFYELLKKTMARQSLTLYTADYFHQLLKNPQAKLYLAKYEGKYIAANIIIWGHDTAVYLFGATDYEYRQVMAPHLLQWRAIKDAKDEGLWFYDFWGAAPKEAKGAESKWFGFTKFKMGFSPNAEITEFIGTFEKRFAPVRLGVYRYLQKTFRK